MNQNYRQSDNVVRMEKKASNKFGLFVLFIMVLAALVVGGKYLYDNKDELEWDTILPWVQNKDETVLNKDSGKTEKNKKKSNGSLIAPKSMDDDVLQLNEGYIKFTDVKATDKGYVFKIEGAVMDADVMAFVCEKVLIDGFDTTASFELVDYKDQTADYKQIPTSLTFQIDKTELDALGINSFEYLTLFMKTKSNLKESSVFQTSIKAINNETVKVDNEYKGLVKIDDKNNILASYYETLEDKEATYIYFNFKNNNRNGVQTIKIKKLLINGEVYEDTKFSADVYSGSKIIPYIKIPKDKIENVKSFTVSFFYIDPSTGEKTPSYYITNEYTKEF